MNLPEKVWKLQTHEGLGSAIYLSLYRERNHDTHILQRKKICRKHFEIADMIDDGKFAYVIFR